MGIKKTVRQLLRTVFSIKLLINNRNLYSAKAEVKRIIS